MAEAKKNAPAEKVQETEEEKKGSAEKQGGNAEYTVEELIAAADQVFEQPSECAKVALALSKKKKMTVEEAKRQVDAFMRREVK